MSGGTSRPASGPARTCPTSPRPSRPTMSPPRGRGRGRQPRRRAVHHAGRRARGAVRPLRPPGRAPARPLRAQGDPLHQPAVRPAAEPGPPGVPARAAATTRPAATRPAETYPYVFTTYRLTEHHTAGGMSRFQAYLAELQPEMFCEVSPELAAERKLVHGGWATIVTARAAIEARVMVTDRVRPLTVGGRTVHQVGLPYHWGHRGWSPATPPTTCCRSCSTPTSISRRPRRRPATSVPAAARAGPPCPSWWPGTGRGPGWRRMPMKVDLPPHVRGRLRRPGPAAHGLLHRHLGLHRLQGLRGRLQGVEPGPPGRPAQPGNPSLDNTGALGASTWRHVAFVEQQRDDQGLRWLMSSDVCKHCSSAACLEVCPTGRCSDRVRHRGRPAGHLQRLRLRARLPVRGHRPARGRRPGLQVHPLLRPAARRAGAGLRHGLPDRLDPVRRAGRAAGASRAAGGHPARGRGRRRPAVPGGRGRRRRRRAFFLLLDEPEVYGLPPDPVSPPATCPPCGGRPRSPPGPWLPRWPPRSWAGAGEPAPATAATGAPGGSAGRWCPRPSSAPTTADPQGAGLDLEVPWYFFAGGLAGASASLGLGARLTGNHRLARSAFAVAGAGGAASVPLLVSDLGRPERFLYMLRCSR